MTQTLLLSFRMVSLLLLILGLGGFALVTTSAFVLHVPTRSRSYYYYHDDALPMSFRTLRTRRWALKNETTSLQVSSEPPRPPPTLLGDDERRNNNNNNMNPFQSAQETWESFSSSSMYRTLLLTGALFSSPKVRDMINPIIIIGVFGISWAAFTYETRFNDLADYITPQRQAAMTALRQAKANLLSPSASTSRTATTSTTPMMITQDINQLSAEYERLLREELKVRVIIPGIWILEMDQVDRDNALQLLQLEVTDQYTLEPKIKKKKKKKR